LASFHAETRDDLHKRSRIIEDATRTRTEGPSGDGRARFTRALDGAMLSTPGPSIALPDGWGSRASAASPCEPAIATSPNGSRLVISERLRRPPADLGRPVPALAGFTLYVRGELEDGRSVVFAAIRSDAESTWRRLRYDAAGGGSEDDAIDLLRSLLRVADRGLRVRMVPAEAGETLRAVRDRACPGAALPFVSSLTGMAAETIVGPVKAVRCLDE